MKSLDWQVWVGVFIALCLVASACGSSGGDDDAAPEPSPTTVPAVPTAASSEPVAVGPLAGEAGKPVGAVVAEADGGAAVWSGSVEGLGDGDVAIRGADVSVEDFGVEELTAEEWAAAVELGPGYEIGYGGHAALDGSLDVTLPLPGDVAADDMVFVWFSSGDGGQFAPGVYDPQTGMVTASIPAELLNAEGPDAEVTAPATTAGGRSRVVAAPGGGLAATGRPSDTLVTWLHEGVKKRIRAVAGKVWRGVEKIYDSGKELLRRGAEKFIDGITHVWNGVKWVSKAFYEILRRGWLWTVDKIEDLLNNLTGRTRPPCSGDALVLQDRPDRGAPAWSEVTKHELNMVHVCKTPASDGVRVTLKSNRAGAMLVQVPDTVADLHVDLQSSEWMRETLAEVASLWPYEGDGPQQGHRPILLLGGSQMGYTLQQPEQDDVSVRVKPAAYQTISITLINALFAAVPALKDAVDELVALFSLGHDCWTNLNNQTSVKVWVLVECYLSVFEPLSRRNIEEVIQEAGSDLKQEAADHIRRNRARLTQTYRKLISITNAVKSAGGWITAIGGLILWAWDAYHDNTDIRILRYTLTRRDPVSPTQTRPDEDKKMGTPTGGQETVQIIDPLPAAVGAASGRLTTLSSSWDHVCGSLQGGATLCWGTSTAGDVSAPPEARTGVSVSADHSCALDATNAVVCWGSGFWGQTDAPEGTFSAVAAGWDHTCGLNTSGQIECWGNDTHGQASPPTGRYSAVTAGDGHSCALGVNGAITCWGLNDNGQASPPTGRYSAIDTGSAHSCALDQAGAVVCWGANWFSQTDTPQGTYTAVAAGYGHTCALDEGGLATCWGLNTHYQANPPQRVFTTITAGRSHTCALDTRSEVMCWGSLTPEDS